MKINYVNKLKMGQVTLGCLQEEDNALLWKDIIGLEEGVDSLEKTVNDILACGQKQTARTGYSAEEKNFKMVLGEAAWTVCCGLQSLASQTNNTRLAAQVKFCECDMGRGREGDFVNRCKDIAALGTEHAGLIRRSE